MGDVADSMLDGTCCQICGQVLNNSGGGGFPVTCGFCNVATRKSYDCWCGASFPLLAGLTQHFTANHAIYMQRTKSQKTTALFLPGNKERVATMTEYLAAWDAIIQPLEDLLGMKVLCYDTAIVLRDMQTGDLQELSVNMARRLVALRPAPTPESSGNAFLKVMREHAVRAILAEEDKKVLDWVNSQPVVDVAAPPVTFLPNPEKRQPGTQIASVGSHIVSMGEGHADIDTGKCPIHGEQPHIGGYNQGGWDSMAVCLKCCAAIYAAWLARDITPEQKAGDERTS